jgi:hypothetical protein
MDPYLEGAEWMSFHAEFCVEIARQLRPKLRPKYIAQTIKRFVSDSTNLLAIFSGSFNPSATTPGTLGGGSKNIYPETVMPEIVPQYAVEIRDLENRQLVTLIEVLSPANRQGDGYEEYRNKRQRILLSSTHLLEIDLLRKGQRIPMRQPLPPAAYFVFLSRQQRRPMTEVWQIALNQRLPTVPVPLQPGDADVGLDLAQALTDVYDSVEYNLLIDYTRPPDVPLEGEDAAWAAQVLQHR